MIVVAECSSNRLARLRPAGDVKRSVCVVALGALFLACQPAEPKMSDEKKLEKIQALYTKYQRKFPEVRSISPQDLREIRQGDREMVIVDVRKPEEQEVSMIPGAITAGEFEARSKELQGKLVVTYCTMGYRSGLYARQLQQQGWEVANLAGSVLAWTHAGQELVDAGGPTSRVHVYGKDWNLAADGYDPVW